MGDFVAEFSQIRNLHCKFSEHIVKISTYILRSLCMTPKYVAPKSRYHRSLSFDEGRKSGQLNNDMKRMLSMRQKKRTNSNDSSARHRGDMKRMLGIAPSRALPPPHAESEGFEICAARALLWSVRGELIVERFQVL